MKRYCLALDLVDDEEKIEAYDRHHREVWPEVLASIQASGILQMEIYRLNNRLCMIMETEDDFDFGRKEAADLQNERVQEWEKVMWKYQQAIPGSKPGEKWRMMKKIFSLSS